jgi:integrase
MWRALKAAGITRPFRLHDLRHTYASLAIRRGVDLLVVSRQLGHHSIKITADLYGHLAPEATRKAADAWEAILTAPARNPGATADSLPA